MNLITTSNLTGGICRVAIPKEEERNPSPLTKRYEEKNFI